MKTFSKRTLALVCTMTLLLALAAPVLAAGTVDPCTNFTDLIPGSWYYDSVRYTLEQGLFYGTSATTFRPEGDMSRAMLVTVLWRLAKKPANSHQNPFRDVPAGKYYTDAVLWAAENGIVYGVTPVTFRPDDPVTREQMAAILYRYGEKKGLDMSPRATLTSFPDVDRVGGYARENVAWAIGVRLVAGASAHGVNQIQPKVTATRAQVAVLICRFATLLSAGETGLPPDPGPQDQAGAVTLGPETLLIDGEPHNNCYWYQNEPYLALSDLARLGDGAWETGYNFHVRAWGSDVYFGLRSSYVLWRDQFIPMPGPCVLADGRWYAPAGAAMKALGFAEARDTDRGTIYYTSRPRNTEVPSGIRIPIFRCHAVGNEIWGEEGLYLPPEKVEEQLRYLLDHGYTPITFEDLDRVDQIQKPVMLTFDDGYRDNYTELFPLLQKYRVKATIFLITGAVGRPHFLTPEQIAEMQASGLVSFQSHSVKHHILPGMTEQAIQRELENSRLEVARLTGKVPFAFSYPEARVNRTAAALVKQYYEFSVYETDRAYFTGTDPYAISRFAMPRDMTMDDFIGYLGEQ